MMNYDYSMVQAAATSEETKTKIGNDLNHDNIYNEKMTGEARVLQILSTSCLY